MMLFNEQKKTLFSLFCFAFKTLLIQLLFNVSLRPSALTNTSNASTTPVNKECITFVG